MPLPDIHSNSELANQLQVLDKVPPMPEEYKQLFAPKNRVVEVMKQVGYWTYLSTEYGSIALVGLGLYQITGDRQWMFVGAGVGLPPVGLGFMRRGFMEFILQPYEKEQKAG